MANSKHSNIIRTALIISWIIIGIGIRRVFFRGQEASINEVENINNDILEQRFYIDESVLLDGTISRAKGFELFTHDFIDTNGTTFGLKSSDIDLYEYDGEVSIKGTVVDIMDETPLIKVSEIIGQQGTEDVEKLQPNDSYSYFKNAGIGLDLSISQGYEVEQQGGEIVLLDTKSGEQIQTVLSIAPFQCTPGDSLRDCETLKKNFYDLNSETFTSDNGITFFNLTETNTRLMFDTKGRGYYVKPRDKDKLISFVDMIQFLDNETLKDELMKETQTSCKTLEQRLGDRSNVSLTIQNDGLISGTVSGPSLEDGGILLTCTYTIRPGTIRDFQLLSVVTGDATGFEVVPFEGTPPIVKTDLPIKQEQEVEPIPEPDPVEEPVVKEQEVPEENTDEAASTGESLSNTDALKNAINSLVTDTQENLGEGNDTPTEAPTEEDSGPRDPSFIDTPQEKPEGAKELTFEEIQKIEQGLQPENTEADDTPAEIEEPADTEQEEIEQATPNPVPDEIDTPTNSRYEGRLSFESVRGYTTYFGDHKLAFAGQYVSDEKKIEVDGADCGYGVHIINRSKTSQVIDAPDSIIYECNGALNKASLPNDTTYLTEFNGKHFIKKDFTSAFAGMEVGIE